MNRILNSLILFLGIMAIGGGQAHANKTMEIQQELASKKASHAVLAKKADTLNYEVTSLERKLVALSANLRLHEETLSDTDQKLQDLRQKKTMYIKRLYKDQQAMGGIVSATRRYTQTPTASMLVQSKPIDAARASMIMKSAIPQLHAQSVYAQSRLSEIAGIENAIAEQLDTQTAQNKQLNQQQEALSALLKERKNLYKSTENERRAQEKEVAALAKESRNLEELMEKLKVKSKSRKDKPVQTAWTSFLPTGTLLPVHGKILTGFGDKDALGADSKGITFLTRSEATVITPLAGKVKFAGAFQGYKQILIVEHQGGYHSLVAGLARIDTVAGASLAAGEPVGVAQNSGSPQIYYELRQNGKPVNPKKLLVAQKKQEKS